MSIQIDVTRETREFPHEGGYAQFGPSWNLHPFAQKGILEVRSRAECSGRATQNSELALATLPGRCLLAVGPVFAGRSVQARVA